MRIKHLHVRGFGKIQNFSADFSDGFNVVYGPNESGKSTLMAFIKAMLYGLRGGRNKKDGTAPGLKRYRPWQGNFYGGTLVFELDGGRTYRLDRNFESGEVKLFDHAFNDVTLNFSVDRDFSGLAEKLTGLSESLFERTVFVSQMGTRIDGAESKDLIERISNLSRSGVEDISYKRADSALRDALKNQIGTDRSSTRPLDIILQRLDELGGIRQRIAQQKEAAAIDERCLQQILEQIDRLENKEKLFSKLLELVKIKETLKMMDEKADEISFLRESAAQCKINIQNFEQGREMLLKEQKNKIKTWNTFGGFALLVINIAAWGLQRTDILPWIPALLISLLSLVLAGLKISLNRLTGEGGSRFFRKINWEFNQQIDGLKDRITSETARHEQLTERLERLESNYNEDGRSSVETRKKSILDIAGEMKQWVSDNLTASERIVVNHTLEGDSPDGNEPGQVLDFIRAEIHSKRLEYIRIKTAIAGKVPQEDEGLIEEEMQRLAQQKEILEQKGEALSIAIKALEEAAVHVQSQYIPVMNRVFKSTFSDLTHQKYLDIRAGENLNIMLNDPETDMIVPISVLSAGTIDQLYLALRTAIAKTVFKVNETLPFILDEPFAQYDDERTIHTLHHMYEISRQRQVILYTCKKREADLVREMFPSKMLYLGQ